MGATVAAARPTDFDAPLADPWTETESRSQMMVVLGLAAAGLVALATSIGRFLSLSI